MFATIKRYPRETFELAFGYESSKKHPYNIDYKDQNRRTWMGYIPVFGQMVYGVQLIWLFKKNVNNKILPCTPEWTARFLRSLVVLSMVGVVMMIFLDAFGTLTIHLHSKDRNVENHYYQN